MTKGQRQAVVRLRELVLALAEHPEADTIVDYLDWDRKRHCLLQVQDFRALLSVVTEAGRAALETHDDH